MRWLTSFAGYCAPLFLIMSPILSYSDQALSMHRNKSSAGFSLDIPLIMLVASFFRSVLDSLASLFACSCRRVFSHADIIRATGYSTTPELDSTARC